MDEILHEILDRVARKHDGEMPQADLDIVAVFAARFSNLVKAELITLQELAANDPDKVAYVVSCKQLFAISQMIQDYAADIQAAEDEEEEDTA